MKRPIPITSIRVGMRVIDGTRRRKVMEIVPACTRRKVHVRFGSDKGDTSSVVCYDVGAYVEVT